MLLLMGRGLAPRVVRDTLTTSFVRFAPVAIGALALTGTSDAVPGVAWIARARPAGRRPDGSPATRSSPGSPPPLLRARAHHCAARDGRGRPAGCRAVTPHGPGLRAWPAARGSPDRSRRVLHRPGRTDARMHVGAVMIFDGPPPAYEDIADHVRSAHLVPRFRQKLAFPPAETGRPLWVDDPSFNLQYHVRDTALPAWSGPAARARRPRALAGARPLQAAVGDVARARVEGRRFALITKTHHALVDGVSGVDLATVLFDLGPVPARPITPPEPWTPRPTPNGLELAARGVRGLVALPFEAAARAVGAATRPATRCGDARGRSGARRGRLGRAQPQHGDTAQRRDRAAPAARLGPPRAGRLQARQGRARRNRQRRRARDGRRRAAGNGCARAACAPRGWSCARSCRSRSARATSTTSSATGSLRCAGRCRSTSRIRSAATGRARRDERAQGLQAGARRRGAEGCRRSHRRRSSPRRRG